MAKSDREILGTVIASVRTISREMEADLASTTNWSKDAWIRAYDSRLNYLRRVLKWAEDQGFDGKLERSEDQAEMDRPTGT